MHKIICLVLCLCVSFSLVGCAVDYEGSDQSLADVLNTFFFIESEGESILSLDLICVATCPEGRYYVEPVTGVMYLWLSGGYKGGLSVMYDIDGLPLNYSRFYDLYEDLAYEDG